jgi:hypothetical protein
MRLTIPLWTLLFAGIADAATITVVPPERDRPTVVLVQGTFNPEDGEEFARKVASVTNPVVIFNSDGGSVLAGITIGEEIFQRKLSTLVPDSARCASACAIAWLGGTKRFMGAEAKIGFHAAYNAQTGRESGAANAVIGAYLNKLGLPYSTIIYITQTAPSSMTWLSMDDAVAQGIQVTLLKTPAVRERPSPASRESEGRDSPDDHRSDE